MVPLKNITKQQKTVNKTKNKKKNNNNKNKQIIKNCPHPNFQMFLI